MSSTPPLREGFFYLNRALEGASLDGAYHLGLQVRAQDDEEDYNWEWSFGMDGVHPCEPVTGADLPAPCLFCRRCNTGAPQSKPLKLPKLFKRLELLELFKPPKRFKRFKRPKRLKRFNRPKRFKHLECLKSFKRLKRVKPLKRLKRPQCFKRSKRLKRFKRLQSLKRLKRIAVCTLCAQVYQIKTECLKLKMLCMLYLVLAYHG